MIKIFVASLLSLRPYRPSPTPLRHGETLARFTWRNTGTHQIYAGLIAVLVAILEFAPVDLQRRIIDDAIMTNDVQALLLLCAVYLAVVLLQAALKYALQIYQSWLSESILKVSREQLAAVAAQAKLEARAGRQSM